MKDKQKIKEDMIAELESKIAETEASIVAQGNFYASEVEKAKEKLETHKVLLEALKKK